MGTVRLLISLPEKLAAAARRKSKETGVPLSVAAQRLLASWIAGGTLPPARPEFDDAPKEARPKRRK